MALEMLALEPADRLLDIGGFSRRSGACFFADLAQTVCPTTVLDPDVEKADAAGMVSADADYAFLRDFLPGSGFTKIACLSALEHVPIHQQAEMVRGLNEFFEGRRIVFTFEFQASRRFFEHQLTAADAHTVFRNLRNFYPARIEASSVWCQNAWKNGPAWYPLAVCFDRI